jgi:hypothetical protein
MKVENKHLVFNIVIYSSCDLPLFTSLNKNVLRINSQKCCKRSVCMVVHEWWALLRHVFMSKNFPFIVGHILNGYCATGIFPVLVNALQ